MNFRYTGHALTVLAEREISLDFVQRVASRPEWTEPDPVDPTIERRFGPIEEHGNRILRVACVETAEEIRILTAFFDRRARRPE